MRIVCITGELASCSCGAVSKPGKLKRFLDRHPKLCNQKEIDCEVRKAFSKQLAAGTRSVINNDWHELSPGQRETVREILRKK